MKMLEARGIETYYGASQALFGVDLNISEGEVVALLGRNGMGKSTTIRSILRLTPPKTGSIRFAGKDVSALKPHRIAQLGIGLVPEGRRCFGNLTVAENLLATARKGVWNLSRIADLFPRLSERRNQSAATLSGGEQQMLAIGRALMTNPKLLILDEATEGLAPVIRQEIWAAIRQLKADGLALLIVDKTLKELLPISEHCVILEKGRSVWTGPADGLGDSLRNRYLGV
ncbi:MAG: ABC transporter ATP-binding protein [Stappiaceae bacterium]